MQALGLDVWMLTGDRRATAEAVAAQVGIDRSGSWPRCCRRTRPPPSSASRREGGIVAMVGDGINDAPALAQADLGIAIGTGTDVAMEATDITLVGGDLAPSCRPSPLARDDAHDPPEPVLGVRLQRAAHPGRGRACSTPGGLAHPGVAAGAMALSSVSVVTNSLRLRGFRAA